MGHVVVNDKAVHAVEVATPQKLVSQAILDYLRLDPQVLMAASLHLCALLTEGSSHDGEQLRFFVILENVAQHLAAARGYLAQGHPAFHCLERKPCR